MLKAKKKPKKHYIRGRELDSGPLHDRQALCRIAVEVGLCRHAVQMYHI